MSKYNLSVPKRQEEEDQEKIRIEKLKTDYVFSEEHETQNIRKVLQAGNHVFFGHNHVLQLDLDHETEFEESKRRISKLKYNLSIASMYYTRSKSNNWHIYINLLHPMELRSRVYFQALLGSDPVREYLNGKRVEARNGECFLEEVSNVQYIPLLDVE
jgi:hypothetical protein